MMHSRPEDSFNAMQQSFSGSELTPFDAYHHIPTFGSNTADFYSGTQSIVDASKEHHRSAHQQRNTPSGSASPSIPHSFDHPPSVVSSMSGASGHSTASSAVGSPYSLAAQALPGQESWPETNQGLGLAPDIVHNDGLSHDFFSRHPLENEYSFNNSKLHNSFVGELRDFQSSLLSNRRSVPATPISFAPTSQSYLPVLPSSLALDTCFAKRDITIDSVLEEADSNGSASTHLISPLSARPTPSSSNVNQPNFARQPTQNSFKSPTTPASAICRPVRNVPTGIPQPKDNLNQSLSSSTSHPTLIQPFDAPITHNPGAATTGPFSGVIQPFHLPSQTLEPPSPAPSDASSHESYRPHSAKFRSSTASPFLHTSTYHPYPRGSEARRMSVASSLSRASQESPRSTSLGFDEEGKERGRCPNIDCGRIVKDLKAHMLTHQSERPEKCPIVTCEYHQKGFARKYDKNRHTLTHYKGTMVCGFCPGSGSAAEKSFNRADVFKRHLTSVHGVEQTPPNSRKKSPSSTSSKKTADYSSDAAGKCSTCSAMFTNAQEFYEHLDDCVLRVVQQEEPSEAINEQRLAEVANDQTVLDTLDRHMLPTTMDFADQNMNSFAKEDNDSKPEAGGQLDAWTATAHGNIWASKGSVDTSRSNHRNNPGGRVRGMTRSKIGAPLIGKGRKKRKHYPVSWGCSADKMKMKKRVLCVYDGPRRLWKDDMMLDSEFEVRMRLGDGSSYVTDLDVTTLKRANALHDATEQEKGPWMSDEEDDIEQLMS
ncbi:MAG: hypothetical protein Q9214_000191 [Letrouitia sp. 1 TL-2023]